MYFPLDDKYFGLTGTLKNKTKNREGRTATENQKDLEMYRR